MRMAEVFLNSLHVGRLIELEARKKYRFEYDKNYTGAPVSLTMPVRPEPYDFECFPPFFEGLLPEGFQLESLLKIKKIDRNDYFGQLVAVGKDLVGAVQVEASRE